MPDREKACIKEYSCIFSQHITGKLNQMESILRQIEDYFPQMEEKNTAVSEKGVGWHLDHSLRVIGGVSALLKSSDPAAYKWKFNFTRMAVYTFNYIPRGVGKAPKQVLNEKVVTLEILQEELEKARQECSSLAELDPKSNFQHPYFGILNLKQSQKFLKIHTRHHLKIVRDILKG